jgi:hypothetical protein
MLAFNALNFQIVFGEQSCRLRDVCQQDASAPTNKLPEAVPLRQFLKTAAKNNLPFAAQTARAASIEATRMTGASSHSNKALVFYQHQRLK